MNWLDVIILLLLAYFVYSGIRRGFLAGLIEVLGIMISVGIPLLIYIPAGRLLEKLGVSQVYAGALAFIIIWFITLNFYHLLMRRHYRRIPRSVRLSPANRLLGAIPGIIRGLIIVALLLAIVTALPTALISFDTVEQSALGPPLLNAVAVVTSTAADIFGEALQRALGFLTIPSDNGERLELPFRVPEPVIDPAAEEEMLRLVNRERTQRGLAPFVMDSTIRDVARQHSVEMFQQGFFAHSSPDGRTPFDRMRQGGVRFTSAGENIALAQTVGMAHTGLMQSPGHRENILRPQFRRVGIGSARGGRYGTMFTQNFAN